MAIYFTINWLEADLTWQITDSKSNVCRATQAYFYGWIYINTRVYSCSIIGIYYFLYCVIGGYYRKLYILGNLWNSRITPLLWVGKLEAICTYLAIKPYDIVAHIRFYIIILTPILLHSSIRPENKQMLCLNVDGASNSTDVVERMG